MRNLQDALKSLALVHSGRGALICSPVYETEPVDCGIDAGPYLNAVVQLDYVGQAITLLDALHTIEKIMGREGKRPRNAPRIIDLDILYVGNLTLNNEEIIIPHPRIHLRRFVLAPLCDIRPDLVLPGRNETALELLAKAPDARVAQFAEKLG